MCMEKSVQQTVRNNLKYINHAASKTAQILTFHFFVEGLRVLGENKSTTPDQYILST